MDRLNALSGGDGSDAAIFMKVGTKQHILELSVDDCPLSRLLNLHTELHRTTASGVSSLPERMFGHRKPEVWGAVARQILDGLVPTLVAPLADPTIDAAQREVHRGVEYRTEVWTVSLRLAQLALWLCRATPDEPVAKELLPRATETVFLLTSLPVRLLTGADDPVADRGQGDSAADDWFPAANTAKITPEQVEELHQRWLETGPETLRLYGPELDRARRDWLAVLDSFERYPALVAEGPAELDARLRWLIRVDGAERTGGAARLVHTFRADRLLRVPREELHAAPEESRRESAPDIDEMREREHERERVKEKEFFLDIAADHLLPRYLLDDSFGLLLALVKDGGTAVSSRPLSRFFARWVPNLVVLLPVLVGVIALVTSLSMWVGYTISDIAPGTFALVTDARSTGGLHVLTAVTWAGRLTALVWLLLVALTVRNGRGGSYLGLLRIPAATAFGLGIVASLGTQWFERVGAGTQHLVLALFVLAAGYLMIEVVNQGAQKAAISQRSVLLAVFGYGVAVMVVNIVFWVSAPVFLDPGELGDTAVDYLAITLTGGAVAFTLGVFLQAIWDESPLTAPLSRMRLR